MVVALLGVAGGILLSRPVPAPPARQALHVPAAAAQIVRLAPSVAFLPGDVFAGVGGGLVNHYDPTGIYLETLDTGSGSSEQSGMCFDTAGNLYTTNWSAGSMSKFNNLGVRLAYPWGGPFSNYPESCVIDAAGYIYVGEVSGANNIRKFDANGVGQAAFPVAVEARGADWLDLANDQCTMYYTSEGHRIKRYDLCAVVQLPDLVTNLPGQECYALRLRDNGEVMVACSDRALRLSRLGAVVQQYPVINYPGANLFFATNLDPDGTSFWTGDFFSGNIYKIDIATGALLLQFTAPPVSAHLSGLAIYGEFTQGLPTPTVGTPLPTRTPLATRTATPTNTPIPSDTPIPSNTPIPSDTPSPSNTPLVTGTLPPNSPTPPATVTPPRPSTPTPTPTHCTITFTDVDQNNPFFAAIRCLSCQGIISGYSDGTFRWQNSVTRGQVSKMVANSAHFTEPIPSSQQTFADVPPTSTFWVFIERLAGRGFINGYDCGGPNEPCDPARRPYFRPNADVTRGQLAKIDANAAGYGEAIPSSQQTFADVAVGSAFWLWVERVALHGVLSGYTCGGPGEPCDPLARPYFRAYNTATRGQASKIVANTFFPACQPPAQ
jgi:hypothetical protein